MAIRAGKTTNIKIAPAVGLLMGLAAAPSYALGGVQPDEPMPAELARPMGGRTVVIPIKVGVAPDEVDAFVAPLAEGLTENPRWKVEAGANLQRLRAASESAPTPATPSDWERLGRQLDEAATLLAKPAAAEAATALQVVRSELQRAFRAGPWSERGAALLYRAGGLQAAAHAGAGDPARAATVAGETVHFFPGRKPSDADRLPREAMDLLALPPPVATATLRVLTSPEGCPVTVNGVPAGNAPIEIGVTSGEAYFAQAKCGDHTTRPRRLFAAPEAVSRKEVLDADFERALDWSSGVKLRFRSSAERKLLEESYARRAAETFDAGAVVFVSAGQLGGADVINARVYLRSGYLVRQALARLEAPRVRALGVYISTGKASPGVLLAEEAAALALAPLGTTPPPLPEPPRPWYNDWLGWSLAGAGVAGVVTGLVWGSMSTDRRRQADGVARTDPEREQTLRRNAGDLEFRGYVSLALGATLALSGVLVLAIPDEARPRGEIIGFAPTNGGGAVTWSSRF